jgi:hypothetical protein
MKQNTTLALVITALLVFSIAVTLTPTISAQTSGQMQTYSYLIVEPNPVGVGLSTYVAMMVDVPLPIAAENTTTAEHDYKLPLFHQRPHRDKTWAEVKDTTGVQSTSFTPTKS